MNANERLARAVADERERRGMSQSALGRAMQANGFDTWLQTTVSKAEAGRRRFFFDEAITIATLLDVDLAEFKVATDFCAACFNAPPAGFTCNICGRSS
jgi:transcriptional regulator with XRE-family HTH domain